MKTPNYFEIPLRMLRFLCFRRRNDIAAALRYSRLKIVGEGNRIESTGKLAFSDAVRMSIKIHGNNNTIRIGKIKVDGRLWISVGGGNRNICDLADGVCVIERCRIEICKHCNDGDVHVGENTTFRDVTIRNYDHGSSVSIGKDCMFSYGILITNTDEHAILHDGHLSNAAHDLKIGNHVWLGIDAMVFKNSVIGDHSVVAARACVAGRFEDSHVILAGVPARIVKHDIEWRRKSVNHVLDE